MILTLLACTDPPATPPPTQTSHVFVAEVDSIEGDYALYSKMVEYGAGSYEFTTAVRVELTLDGEGARYHTIISTYEAGGGISPRETTETRAAAGTWALLDGEVVLDFVDGSTIPCTLGKLDGHTALACAPSPVTGGQETAIPLGLGSDLVYLGRPPLSATITRHPVSLTPERPTWELSW